MLAELIAPRIRLGLVSAYHKEYFTRTFPGSTMRGAIKNMIYGTFHGRFTVKIFFSTKHFFLPFYSENNRNVFFFSM